MSNKLKPEDIVELQKTLVDMKALFPVIKELIKEMLPDILDMLSPISDELILGSAKIYKTYLDSFIEQGFTKDEAFDLLLSWETRMEKQSYQNMLNTNGLKIDMEDIKKKRGFFF